jgi:hypothetical protein
MKEKSMLANNISPDWSERYARVFDVSLEEGDAALVRVLNYSRTRRIKCQAPGCPNFGGPFILDKSPELTVLRYFCPEHWLFAAEKNQGDRE